MITSYTVGAIFEIQASEATTTLERLGAGFAALDEKITALQAKMGVVGKGEGLFTGITAGLTELGGVFDRLGVRATEAGDAIVRAMERGATAARTAASEINAAVDAAGRMGGTGFRETGGAGPRTGPTVMPTIPLIGGPRPDYIDVPSTPIDRLRLGGPSGGAGGGGSGGGGASGFTMPGGSGGGYGSLARVPAPQTLGPLGMPQSQQAGGSTIGMVEIAEALLGWREFRLAGQEDLALRQSAESLNVRPDDKEFGPMIARLKKTAQAATDKTIVSEPEGAKMLQHFAGIMIGSGQMGMEQVEALFPLAARLAELSHQRTGEALGPSAVAGGEFAHLTGNYTAEGMGPLLDLINAISKRTNTTIGQQQQIQRYGMPMAIAAGISPEDASIEMAFAELNMGATTRAGTAFGQFVTASLTGGEAKTLHQHVRRQRAAREFEQAMRLEDPEGLAQHQATMKDPRQLEAMEKLGLIDRTTKRHLNLTPDGGLNLDFEKSKILEFALAHTPQQTTTTLKDAFGQIGFREAELFIKQDAVDRETMLRGAPWKGVGPRMGVLGAPTVIQEQGDLMRSPLQQFQQLLAQADTILSTLAGSTLPAFATGLARINTVLGTGKDWLRAHPDEQAPIATTLGGLILGGAGGAMNWASKNVTGMKGAAGRGLGGLLGVGGGLLALGGAAGIAFDALESGSDTINDALFGKGAADARRYQHALDSPIPWMRPGGYLGPAIRDDWVNSIAPQPAPVTARVGPRADSAAVVDRAEPGSPAPITVNVTTNVSGVIDEHSWSAMLARLMESIKTAMQSATEGAHGSHVSPYISNGSL